MVLASHPCTDHLDGNSFFMTGNNCPNITNSHRKDEKFAGKEGQFFKNCERRLAVV